MTNRCPRFDRCGASLCPLTMEGCHLDGEPICEYLRLAAKNVPLPPKVALTIQQNLTVITASVGDIRRRLTRASKSPPRGANLTIKLVDDTAQKRDSRCPPEDTLLLLAPGDAN